ncbi:MAG: sensor histidine kinase [Acutalibacteraceae bacterium]
MHIKDGGKGIPDEDMPFVLEKFYRGKNVGNNQGSGLGLYIVNYVMKQMNGEIRLENKSDGLEVILKFICNS